MYLKTTIVLPQGSDGSQKHEHYCIVEAQQVKFDAGNKVILSSESFGFAVFECFRLTAPQGEQEYAQAPFYQGSVQLLY